MTVLRCTAKLLKRFKQPAKLPEPEPQANPLGEWYADMDFWNRKPYVVMLNAATGAMLVLNGNAPACVCCMSVRCCSSPRCASASVSTGHWWMRNCMDSMVVSTSARPLTAA